jgi:hypothetical protein
MKLHVGAMLRQAWHGEEFSVEAFIGGEDEVLQDTAFWREYWVWVKIVRRITHSRKFGLFITLTIVLTALNLGLRVNGRGNSERVSSTTHTVEVVCNSVSGLQVQYLAQWV